LVGIGRPEKIAMAETWFVVRAELADPADRERFDHWYASDHLPWAVREVGARRGWRCWSRTEPHVHFAFYEFADREAAEAGTAPERLKPLIADFDRVWGARVARRREMLEIVQQIDKEEGRR
jgi:hypothetical protein